MNTKTDIELPRYKCHKEVHALQIAHIEFGKKGDAILRPVIGRYALIPVDADFVTKHKPFPGGYYVVYEDDYKSFSPQGTFESGYKLVGEGYWADKT